MGKRFEFNDNMMTLSVKSDGKKTLTLLFRYVINTNISC